VTARRRPLAIALGAFVGLIALAVWFAPPARHRGADLWWCSTSREFRESPGGASLPFESEAILAAIRNAGDPPPGPGPTGVYMSGGHPVLMVAWPESVLERVRVAIFGRATSDGPEFMAMTDDKVDADGRTWIRCQRASPDPLGRR
jgi:hypothetical protein